MNEFREQWLAEREANDEQLFNKIKENPSPDILDLWYLSEKRFVEWRKLHDFPVLLKHFEKVLPDFGQWMKTQKLTAEIIIETGKISPFLEHKKLAKQDKTLHLTRQIWDGKVRTYASYEKREGEGERHGHKFKYEFLLTFIPYLDWLKAQNKSVEILNINSRSAPEHESERVWIHKDVYAPKSDFELLKMGGIELPLNGFGILFRGKALEFVNLCGLKLSGEILFGEEGNLSCSYCACDNWSADGFGMSNLDLDHCSVENFNAKDSKLDHWRFYDCQVTGDFVNTKLYGVRIFGGNFSPVLQHCVLDRTHILEDANIADQNFYAYRNFKKIYQDQGDDDIAKSYFIKENEFVRKGLKGWNFLTKTLSYYYWEYGRKPHRIIYLSLAMILFFSIFYALNPELIAINSSKLTSFSWGDSLYLSTITFTTLGYGDFSPMGGLRIIASLESLLGVVNMGFLIAGYSNNKY